MTGDELGARPAWPDGQAPSSSLYRAAYAERFDLAAIARERPAPSRTTYEQETHSGDDLQGGRPG